MSALGQKQTPEAFRQCPLYPQKQTLIEGVEMSALCQKRTSTGVSSIKFAGVKLKRNGSSRSKPTTMSDGPSWLPSLL